MKKTIIIFAVVLLNIMFVYAQCPPSIPITFTGSILHNGKIISEDYKIIASIGGRENLGSVTNGEYLIDVSSCYGVSSGTIEFWINGVKATKEPNYKGEEDWGKEINLDLTFDEIPPTENPCGDGIADPWEVCDTNDFRGLTCSNYGFDSGNLSCSDFCTLIYTDGCYNSQPNDNNDNDHDDRRSSSRRSPDSAITLNSNSDIPATQGADNGELSLISSGQEEEQEGFFPTITGAVIGTLGKTGTVLISAIIIALVVGLGFVVLKKRS